MIKFRKGSKVVIKHQRELGVCVVVNGYDKTDMVRVGPNPQTPGEPVGHYVRVDVPNGRKNEGYHECNIEKATK